MTVNLEQVNMGVDEAENGLVTDPSLVKRR